LRWRTLAVPSRGGAVVTNGRVVLAGTNDSLAVLDAATGTLRVRAKLPAPVTEPIALLDDSTLVVSSPTGLVAAASVHDGTIRWSVKSEAPIAGAPVVRGDTVYALTTGCRLLVMPITRPTRPDTHDIGCVTATGPTILSDGVLVATVGGEVIFYDRVRDKRAWTLRTDGEFRHPPLVRNGQILVGSLLGHAAGYR
jgi:hypothetical protein